MNVKRVGAIMVPLDQYPHIRHTCTLREAIEAMGNVQIQRGSQQSLPRVLLVFDDDLRELVGMLRRRDIMRGLEPRFLVGDSLEYPHKLFDIAVDPNLPELSFDKLADRIRQRASRQVKEFTVPIKATIGYDDHLVTAMCEMVDQNTSLLPVLKDRDVVGVVRSVDVLHELSVIIAT